MEHPGRSIALDLESWRTLAEQDFAPATIHVCMREALGGKPRS